MLSELSIYEKNTYPLKWAEIRVLRATKLFFGRSEKFSTFGFEQSNFVRLYSFAPPEVSKRLLEHPLYTKSISITVKGCKVELK